MNFLNEVNKINRLIGEFKKDLYVGGAADSELRIAAEEIFRLFDEVEPLLGGGGIMINFLKEIRADFVKFVVQVYEKRHAPELKKFYLLYKKKHQV